MSANIAYFSIQVSTAIFKKKKKKDYFYSYSLFLDLQKCTLYSSVLVIKCFISDRILEGLVFIK